MIINENEPKSWSDPVSQVSLRIATKKDIDEAEGGSLWRALCAPWHVVCKIMGTAQIIMQGTNALKWTPPVAQKWVHQFTHKWGLNPELVFMDTLNNFIMGNSHRIFGSPIVMKEILTPHRNDEFFKNGMGTDQFLSLLKRIFPEDKLTIEDLMITCSKDFTSPYRKLLMNFLKKSNVREFTPQIRQIAQKMLKSWEERCEKGETINVSHETRLFTSEVICLLILGDGNYAKEAADAINFFNTFALKSMIRSDKKEDNEKFEKTMGIFRKAVEKVLENEEMVPLFGEKNDLTLAQKKAMIFFIFFGGEETAASLLTWDLFQLAKCSDLQEDLYQDLEQAKNSLLNEQESKISKKTEQFFIQQFAKHPPVYGIARTVGEKNLCLKYKLKDQAVSRKKIFYKAEMVMPYIMGRGEQQLEMNNGEVKEQDFTPFGWGAHHCPGSDLAKAEILTFLSEAIQNYTLHTDQKDVERTGALTLQFAEDIHLTIKPRNSTNLKN